MLPFSKRYVRLLTVSSDQGQNGQGQNGQGNQGNNQANTGGNGGNSKLLEFPAKIFDAMGDIAFTNVKLQTMLRSL